jgi:uncharacterized FAD-dependent dehydrogenase
MHTLSVYGNFAEKENRIYMPRILHFKTSPAVAANPFTLKNEIADQIGVPENDVFGFHLLKESIDARSRQPSLILSAEVFVNEPLSPRKKTVFNWQQVTDSRHRTLIAGAGPAGLFAALRLIEKGIKPIVIERGKDVRARRRDLARLNKEGILNPESNYCFGEGGAGTYSDGKLYTRSKKRGDLQRILEIFCHFGADENILYRAHPHIGTNHLPKIIAAMRDYILQCGGEIHFESKLTDLVISNDELLGVQINHQEIIKGDALILATGHSARDIFELLHRKKIHIESKPFALGVRIEHPQALIDSIQYHCSTRDPFLPPAAYSLVEQVQGKGVFSFCMCPGGIIAPASTAHNELVVNGWSPSKRNNAFANSGMVVSVEQKDAWKWLSKQHSSRKCQEDDPLLLLAFQQQVETIAYHAGGGKFKAPAQRVVDFCQRKQSAELPVNSYIPGLTSAPLLEVLPDFIEERLRLALQAFGKKMKGYYTNEAILVATESRTSSPVRIPRDKNSFQHPQLSKLYPCGEGAGYAGGIVSAAMDGEKVAEAIALSLGIFKD